MEKYYVIAIKNGKRTRFYQTDDVQLDCIDLNDKNAAIEKAKELCGKYKDYEDISIYIQESVPAIKGSVYLNPVGTGQQAADWNQWYKRVISRNVESE